VDEDGVEGYVDLGEDDWAGGESDTEAETKSRKKGSKGKESEAKAGAKGAFCFATWNVCVPTGGLMAVYAHLWHGKRNNCNAFCMQILCIEETRLWSSIAQLSQPDSSMRNEGYSLCCFRRLSSFISGEWGVREEI
jgi:hypothetical protein